MRGSHDFTDEEWRVIQPLLPTKVRGVKRADDRRVLNGIFWRLRTGTMAGDTRALRALYDLCQSFQSLAQGGSLGEDYGGNIKGL